MKKSVTLSALLSLTLVSCIVDDRPAGDQSGFQDNTEILLTNKWNLIKGEYYIKTTNSLWYSVDLSDEDCDYNYYEFRTDGVKKEVYHDWFKNCDGENYDGGWIYDSENNIISLSNSKEGQLLKYEIVSITATDLKLKLISDDGFIDESIDYFCYLNR